ncbi:MAG: DUF2961 domain-containing protein [Saprospiraceae bacterium]|nr:DUF2961 domain-containing protein [Saprospiraceae bacterium]
MSAKFSLIISILSISTLSLAQNNSNPPFIPIGTEAYLQWERLPYQSIGMRGYMRSTYDRTGNNRRADASHYLYQESDTFNVALDVENPGIIYFMRTNHFHGSPWHYEVDGHDFLVKETATDDPVDAKSKFDHTTFIPETLFPNPLTWTWAITKGADLMWVPIPFEESLRLAYSRTLYGTGYYIYHSFPKGVDYLSPPLSSWDKKAPNPKVLDLINRSGTDLTAGISELISTPKDFEINPYEKIKIAEFSGTRMIRSIEFKIPRSQALAFGKNRLLITWDHRWDASVDVPLDLFFGAGHLYNPEQKEYLVKGFPSHICYDSDFVYLSCFWPMPFFEHASFELQERSGQHFQNVHVTIKSKLLEEAPSSLSYFHATYSDHPQPKPGQDLTFLDTEITEGGGDWSGKFVGMSWIFSHNGVLRTLEGDPRFFFDDSKTPQGWGTGSEEWGGGGDYWGGLNMTIPFAGHPVGKQAKMAEDTLDLLNSAYRFLIADYFPFGKRAKINLEHGGQNTEAEHYEGVVYWYGAPYATLHLTDDLNVINKADAKFHHYQSPTAERPYELVSRYELGPDTDVRSGFVHDGHEEENINSQLYFPAESDSVTVMRGVTTFRITLDPDNLGVLLRRKFDYQYPNQKARVSVRDASAVNSVWMDAGIWYTPGSNTCYFSYPPGRSFTEAELSPTNPEIVTSNRRWREEEFLIGHQLTSGIKALDIKIEWIPDEKELFPETPFPQKSGWSEARYWIYCYKLPR